MRISSTSSNRGSAYRNISPSATRSTGKAGAADSHGLEFHSASTFPIPAAIMFHISCELPYYSCLCFSFRHPRWRFACIRCTALLSTTSIDAPCAASPIVTTVIDAAPECFPATTKCTEHTHAPWKLSTYDSSTIAIRGPPSSSTAKLPPQRSVT